VDTTGLVLRAVVHPANVSDRDGAYHVLEDLTQRFPTVRHLWVDAGYAGTAVTWIEQTLGLRVTVVRKPRRWIRAPADQEPPPMPTGFQVLPRRWVVERTFAWLGRYRRLSKDYEALPATEEAWIHLAMSSLMLARLAK
jgi:putative transposase